MRILVCIIIPTLDDSVIAICLRRAWLSLKINESSYFVAYQQLNRRQARQSTVLDKPSYMFAESGC